MIKLFFKPCQIRSLNGYDYLFNHIINANLTQFGSYRFVSKNSNVNDLMIAKHRSYMILTSVQYEKLKSLGIPEYE